MIKVSLEIEYSRVYINLLYFQRPSVENENNELWQKSEKAEVAISNMQISKRDKHVLPSARRCQRLLKKTTLANQRSTL